MLKRLRPSPAPRPRRARKRSNPRKAAPREADRARPGATLLNLILAAAAARRMGIHEAARAALGVSPSHFANLRSGDKDVTQLGEERIARAARFLGIPKVSVMLAAGQLRIEDFHSEPDKVNGQLQPALRFILADPELSPYLSPAILKADATVQQAFVLLYERATGRVLIRGRVPAEEIVARHQRLAQAESENADSTMALSPTAKRPHNEETIAPTPEGDAS